MKPHISNKGSEGIFNDIMRCNLFLTMGIKKGGSLLNLKANHKSIGSTLEDAQNRTEKI
jgi:hypothetical protein